ncbi:MAG: nuclear transport factor 2 family protein [Microthrixaceae bacterium]
MPSIDEIKSAVTAYAAAHTRGDIDGIVALFSDDAVVADPVDQPAYVGAEAVRAFFAGTHEMADSLELTITGAIRAVDKFAAVPLRAVTDIGGSKFGIDIVDVFTFDSEGKINDMKAYWSGSDITPL